MNLTKQDSEADTTESNMSFPMPWLTLILQRSICLLFCLPVQDHAVNWSKGNAMPMKQSTKNATEYLLQCVKIYNYFYELF